MFSVTYINQQGLHRNKCPLLRTPASAQDWQPHRWESWRPSTKWTLSCVPCLLPQALIPNKDHPPKPAPGRKGWSLSSLHLWAQKLSLKHVASTSYISRNLPPPPWDFLGKCCAFSVQISKLLPCLLYPHICVCSCVHTRYVLGGMWISWDYYTEKHFIFWKLYLGYNELW